MRILSINIDKRVPTDNEWSFTSLSSFSSTDVYQLISLTTNYSIISSQTTSTLVLSMNVPIGPDNVLRSGQPCYISDNGTTIFQGVLLSPMYTTVPMSEGGQGGTFMFATLAPSIYQLTLTPMIFDSTQAGQVSSLLNVDVAAILAGNVTQSVNTTSFLNYIISNTDYSNIYNNTISASDLSDSIYLMTGAGESRDITVRQSIDFYNCMFYQQEDGTIVIRQLDASIESPFDVDLQNLYNVDPASTEPDNTVPIVPILTYQYQDNAYSTPSVISNYSMLDPSIAIASSATASVLSYAPNPELFSRLQQLQTTGWFTGQIGTAQINNNIAENPTVATALNQFFLYPDQYLITSKATGVKDQFLAAYQALLTAKQVGMSLSGYATLTFTVSLDDPNLPSDLGNLIGTVIQIQNCDMASGIIATATRSYNAQGSYLTCSVAPLGSYSGFWKNSQYIAQFTN